MGFSKLLAVSVLTLAGLSGAALADDYLSFQSRTGNIHCMIYRSASGSDARCDLRELTQSYRKAPQDCDLDWGSAFGVGNRGKGYLVCAGDTVINPGSPRLNYGEAVSLGGISCVSAKTGMTCTNGEGHGFSVAKAKQNLF